MAQFCLIFGQTCALIGLLVAASTAQAQTLQPLSPDTAPPPASSLIDPEVEERGEAIKRQTWRTTPAGENKNWNLDVGRFLENKDEEPDLGEQISEDQLDYSGMRLRLPLSGQSK